MHSRMSLPIILGLLSLVPVIAAVPSSVFHALPSISTIQQELGLHLSKNATLFFPGSPGYVNETERWASNTESKFSVVVVPGTDKDVAATVRFADIYSIPFLAVNRGYGAALGLSTVSNGIEIHIRALNSTRISEDGNSASMGGGVYQDQFVNYLWDHASGACACISIMGPAIGGGLGRYEGSFGLALDNIIELDVVLADGSIITVSDSSYPDLFWGMRGAGHNFGIITRFSYKVHDIPYPDWFVVNLVFTADKLEELFQLINTFAANGTQPKGASTYTLYVLNPEISATEPVILFTFQYNSGPAAETATMLAPFYALGPAVAINQTVPYPESAHASGSGLTDPVCQRGGGRYLFPVGLLSYNITTNRAIYNLFREMINKYPDMSTSTVQFENYSPVGVKAVEADTTAYAHRADNLLVSYAPVWPPNQTALAAVAWDYGHRARALFHAGDVPGHTLNTYVNYASTDETPEMLYGYEPWRLERLRGLKRKYDPRGRFNFYNPIG